MGGKLRGDHEYTEVDFIACTLEVGPWPIGPHAAHNCYWQAVSDWFRHHYPERVQILESVDGYWVGDREFQYAMYVWNKKIEGKPMVKDVYSYGP